MSHVMGPDFRSMASNIRYGMQLENNATLQRQGILMLLAPVETRRSASNT